MLVWERQFTRIMWPGCHVIGDFDGCKTFRRYTIFHERRTKKTLLTVAKIFRNRLLWARKLMSKPPASPRYHVRGKILSLYYLRLEKRLLFTPNHLVHVFLEGLMTSKYDFFCMCCCTYVIVSSINSQVDRDPYLVVGLAFCGMVQLGNWHFLTLAERSTFFFWVGSGHVVSSLFC